VGKVHRTFMHVFTCAEAAILLRKGEKDRKGKTRLILSSTYEIPGLSWDGKHKFQEGGGGPLCVIKVFLKGRSSPVGR